MELEINGRSSFTDTSCGIIIPASVQHGFMAPSGARMFVIDAPEQKGIERLRRFAVTPACGQLTNVRGMAEKLSLICRLPKILTRRGIDLSRLDQAIDAALHEEWNTARMARLFFLSVQRFHVRLYELSGATPQAYLRKRRLGQAMKIISRGMPLAYLGGFAPVSLYTRQTTGNLRAAFKQRSSAQRYAWPSPHWMIEISSRLT
jgi:AraC-like DNA-binding protein